MRTLGPTVFHLAGNLQAKLRLDLCERTPGAVFWPLDRVLFYGLGHTLGSFTAGLAPAPVASPRRKRR